MNQVTTTSTQASSVGEAGGLPNGERATSAILADVLHNTNTLVRKELELALVKLEGMAKEIKTEVTLTVTGAAVLYAGLLALVAACVLRLADEMEPWLAALLVGFVVSAIGYLMLQRGTKPKAVTPSQGGMGQIASMTTPLQETPK